MFPIIKTIADVQPIVAHKKEIRFRKEPNGATVGVYVFSDNHTFDSPEALECRGIAFAEDGTVCSRPLHKFFNAGEKEHLSLDKLVKRTDIAAVFEKLDGSMLVTAWLEGKLQWRSKKVFTSDVVKLAESFLADPEQANISAFAEEAASTGLTAIFELTHPLARIVVEQPVGKMRLLHVRDNVTGEYVLLDPAHRIHEMLARHKVEQVPRLPFTSMEALLATLEGMEEKEGYVVQFANGDMAKLKCPWYLRLHRSITFLRERDIAVSALNEELDDLKGVLAKMGVDLVPVLEVESRLKERLLGITGEIEKMYLANRHLERKDFATMLKGHPLFGLIMARYSGKDPDIKDWYMKNKLRAEFGLRVLADGALAEALEG